jgi:hypothetical protein
MELTKMITEQAGATEAQPRCSQTGCSGDVQAHAALLVDLGQADACEMMGEHKRAVAFRERQF